MDLAAQLKEGEELAALNLEEAVVKLRGLVLSDSNDVEAVKVKEQTIQKLCDLLVKAGNAKALSDLLAQLRDFFAVIPKAKTAKIVRSIIDAIAKIPGSTQLQVHGAFAWASGQAVGSGRGVAARPATPMHSDMRGNHVRMRPCWPVVSQIGGNNMMWLQGAYRAHRLCTGSMCWLRSAACMEPASGLGTYCHSRQREAVGQ